MEPVANTAAAGDAPARPQGQAIDLQHLARMTFGEPGLEAEVLTLFNRQASVLLARMRGSSPAAAAAFAHTLKGSASGIGAWRVAEAADAVEKHALGCPATGIGDAVSLLAAAVEEARAAIADQLRPQGGR